MKLTPLCHALAPFLLFVACGTEETGPRGHLVLPEGTRAPVRSVAVAGASGLGSGPGRFAAPGAYDAPRGASSELDASVLRAQVNSIDAAIRQERDLRRASGPARLRGHEARLHRREATGSIALR